MISLISLACKLAYILFLSFICMPLLSCSSEDPLKCPFFLLRVEAKISEIFDIILKCAIRCRYDACLIRSRYFWTKLLNIYTQNVRFLAIYICISICLLGFRSVVFWLKSTEMWSPLFLFAFLPCVPCVNNSI